MPILISINPNYDFQISFHLAPTPITSFDEMVASVEKQIQEQVQDLLLPNHMLTEDQLAPIKVKMVTQWCTHLNWSSDKIPEDFVQDHDSNWVAGDITPLW